MSGWDERLTLGTAGVGVKVKVGMGEGCESWGLGLGVWFIGHDVKDAGRTRGGSGLEATDTTAGRGRD